MSLTGKQKIEAAISPDGTDEFPVTLTYDPIFFRDHIFPVCKTPWWYTYSPDVTQRTQRASEIIDSLDLDWFFIKDHTLVKETDNVAIVTREDRVFSVDKANGTEEEIFCPPVGGPRTPIKFVDETLETMEDLDKLLIPELELNYQMIRHDCLNRALGMRLRTKYADKFSYAIVFVPIVKFVFLFGTETALITMGTDPEIVRRFCDKYLELAIWEIRNAASSGADCIQIDLGYMDMVSPAIFRDLALPYIADMIDEIKSLGMRSLLNYLGDPKGKLDDLFHLGADIYKFEDGKKGFENDIDRLVDYVQGKVTLQGNLNSITILNDGTDAQLRAEIKRFMDAGRRNKGKFIMSTGSPVMPATSTDRVRIFVEIARELAK